jgi:hypothetical protein
MPTGNIKAQKNWANWILLNEIPIEMRNITGEQDSLKENTLRELDVYLYLPSICCA